MKKISALLLLFFALLNTYSQTDSTVSFVAYWEKGDTKNFRITKKDVRIKDGTETRNEQMEYIVKCTVIDATKDQYTLEWEYDNTMLTNIKIPEAYSEVMKKYKVMKVVYTTNELGAFQDIVNWKEIRNLMYELLETIPESGSSETVNFAKALKPIKELYSTKEGIAALVLKEVQAFHFPMGTAFNVGDTITYPEALPNMLGGDPINGIGTFYFKDVDAENQSCTFVNTLELDSTDSKRVITQFLNSILAKAQEGTKAEKEEAMEKINAEFSKMHMDIKDYNTYEYRYNPGWPIRIHTKRTAIITLNEGASSRVDELFIEAIE